MEDVETSIQHTINMLYKLKSFFTSLGCDMDGFNFAHLAKPCSFYFWFPLQVRGQSKKPWGLQHCVPGCYRMILMMLVLNKLLHHLDIIYQFWE